MTENRRSLDSIAVDIHKLQRSNIFEVGDLLIEAREACEHGDWGDWLDAEFEWSADSAERYMNVARLGTKFRSLRNLKLAKTTLYTLAEEDDEALPAIIDALAKVATETQLKPPDADELARLRHQHGDLPDGALLPLDNLTGREAWHDTAVAALKGEKPVTREAADKVVDDIHRAHVAELFAPHGKLPDVPAGALFHLERAAPECRKKFLERLHAAPQPLTEDQVYDIYLSCDYDAEPEDGETSGETDGETDGEPEEAPPIVLPSAPLDGELLEALNVLLHYARRPRATVVDGIAGADLMEVVRFLEDLHNTMHGGAKAKLAADRAEARSRLHAS